MRHFYSAFIVLKMSMFVFCFYGFWHPCFILYFVNYVCVWTSRRLYPPLWHKLHPSCCLSYTPLCLILPKITPPLDVGLLWGCRYIRSRFAGPVPVVPITCGVTNNQYTHLKIIKQTHKNPPRLRLNPVLIIFTITKRIHYIYLGMWSKYVWLSYCYGKPVKHNRRFIGTTCIKLTLLDRVRLQVMAIY